MRRLIQRFLNWWSPPQEPEIWPGYCDTPRCAQPMNHKGQCD